MYEYSPERRVPNFDQISTEFMVPKKKKVLWKPRSSVNTQTIGVPYPWEQENNDGHAAMPEL